MDELRFLEILAGEASSSDLEEPLRLARTRGASSAELAVLERAHKLALSVQVAAERRARREGELSVLFDTASDLTKLRDVDAVLNAIVRRARQILVTDVAYLALLDDAHTFTFTRVTEGMSTNAIATTRLRIGEGLGGLVAAQRRPYATDDYWADERFSHTDEVDNASKAEGLVAILGVPLVVNTEILGVLYVGDRRKRTYTPDDVALLVSLGHLSAVALDSANALEQATHAADELAIARDLANARAQQLEEQDEAHRQLMAVLLEGGGIGEIGQVIADAVEIPVQVVDGSGASVWPAGGDGVDLRMPQGAAGRQTATDVGGRSWTIVSATSHGQVSAWVAAAGADLDPTTLRILESGAVAVTLVWVFGRLDEQASERSRSELVTDLLSGMAGRSPSVFRRRADRVGLRFDSRHHLLAVRSAETDRQALRTTLHEWTRSRNGALTEHLQDVVIVVPANGQSAGDAARSAAAVLLESDLDAVVGASGPHSGANSIANGYTEASRCAQLLLALGRRGGGAELDDLGIFGVLGVPEAADRAANFARTTLGPLIEYDRARGTNLLETLRVYHGVGRSRADAARDLQVHVNTVGARLDRIGQLLGHDWSSPDRSTAIQMAVQILPLLDDHGV